MVNSCIIPTAGVTGAADINIVGNLIGFAVDYDQTNPALVTLVNIWDD